MEKILSTKITNAVNELKETIETAVAELKETIKENLNTLQSVKQNLDYAHDELEEIFATADALSLSMEIVAEETNDACEDLESVLEIVMPEKYGDFEEEDFEEEEEETCIVVEDTETGEETEYPIN
jgi:ABC-type transporter Mla subunit MlaD